MVSSEVQRCEIGFSVLILVELQLLMFGTPRAERQCRLPQERLV